MEWNEIRRKLKYAQVDFFIWFTNFFFWWLPEKARGYALLILHVSSFVLLWLLFFILPNAYKIIPAIVFVVVLVQFCVFHGCVVTKSEYHFHKSEITGIEPFLFMLQIPPTKRSRHVYAVVLLTASVLLMSVILGSKPYLKSLYNVPEKL
jgi:hypothetical protein